MDSAPKTNVTDEICMSSVCNFKVKKLLKTTYVYKDKNTRKNDKIKSNGSQTRYSSK
jgi:hypothetical protein